ncbi:unnamed protein product [Cyprideis torosa]|uniref:Uncharacterized protein n=1 Tax=Cyprideis torosa TaxID=163714 RepID=A0A7R8ZN85_9CRUS|nr:unnamed protein product [Cyprideis torosa]CAG0895650.1 unnamed protein product [Cyprideis torosa]
MESSKATLDAERVVMRHEVSIETSEKQDSPDSKNFWFNNAVTFRRGGMDDYNPTLSRILRKVLPMLSLRPNVLFPLLNTTRRCHSPLHPGSLHHAGLLRQRGVSETNCKIANPLGIYELEIANPLGVYELEISNPTSETATKK